MSGKYYFLILKAAFIIGSSIGLTVCAYGQYPGSGYCNSSYYSSQYCGSDYDDNYYYNYNYNQNQPAYPYENYPYGGGYYPYFPGNVDIQNGNEGYNENFHGEFNGEGRMHNEGGMPGGEHRGHR